MTLYKQDHFMADATGTEWIPLESSLGGRWTYVEAGSSRTWSSNESILLPREEIVAEASHVVLSNTDTAGTLLVTRARLVFLPRDKSQPLPLGTIALSTIERITKLQQQGRSGASVSTARLLHIAGKDARSIVFAFRPRTHQRTTIFTAVAKLLAGSFWDLPAWFAVPPDCPSMGQGSPEKSYMLIRNEYNRLLSQAGTRCSAMWRISSVNETYSLCSTYPQLLVLPSTFSDADAQMAANFRARGRLPVWCWQHPRTGAVLSRSAQPLVGIMLNSRSDADERLVAALGGNFEGSSSTRKLCIADARPRKNALANGAMGGGSESATNYRSTELMYLGVENIHSMRESLARLRDYLDVHGAACSDGSHSLLRTATVGWGRSASTAGAASALTDTTWLHHIHVLLAGASAIAARIASEGTSVLVHCSDGWDRTPSLLCLALLMLDPFYRTVQGFQVLVEVHWAGFGHPFAERMAVPGFSSTPSSGSVASGLDGLSASVSSASPRGIPPPAMAASTSSTQFSATSGSTSITGGTSSANLSPIFLQWLDCVGQLLRLYPRAFQFTWAFLADVLDATLSCRFGNFLANSERERMQAGVASNCEDLWTHLRVGPGQAQRQARHCNVVYAADAHQEALLPPAAALAPVLLPDLYLRWCCPQPLASLPQCQASGDDAQQEVRRLVTLAAQMEEEKRGAEEREAEAGRRAQAFERRIKELQQDVESEKQCHLAALNAAQVARQEVASLRLSLQAIGCECSLFSPDRAMSPELSASGRRDRHGAAAPIDDGAKLPGVAVALSAQDTGCSDQCRQRKGVETCAWPRGRCVREASSLQGFRADFDAIRNLIIHESYFDLDKCHQANSGTLTVQ